MSPTTERLLKAAILLALGAYLYTRLTTETVLFYINERFVMLTLLAAVGFLLVGASLLLRPGRDHHHTHDHDHDHDHSHVTWIGLLILTVPVIVGTLVPPQPLGANALENREVNVGSLSSIAPPRSNETRMGIVTGEKNIIDWLSEFHDNPDPAGFTGQEAHIIGFVYRDERFTPDSFMVGRFIVSCCVADAAPVGLIVQWPDAPTLADNQWVEVTGHFEPGSFDGFALPVLVAGQVTPTEPPAQPYLYP
jgi:uncharacterized repeat protein (TIGR03943 family)